jgi:hypothetical protein
VARQVFTGVGDNNGRLNNSVLQSAYTVYSQRKEEENPLLVEQGMPISSLTVRTRVWSRSCLNLAHTSTKGSHQPEVRTILCVLHLQFLAAVDAA